MVFMKYSIVLYWNVIFFLMILKRVCICMIHLIIPGIWYTNTGIAPPGIQNVFIKTTHDERTYFYFNTHAHHKNTSPYLSFTTSILPLQLWTIIIIIIIFIFTKYIISFLCIVISSSIHILSITSFLFFC